MNSTNEKMLRSLWQTYLQGQGVLARLDRWLSLELKKYPKERHKDLAMGMFDLLRFALIFTPQKEADPAEYCALLRKISWGELWHGLNEGGASLWESFPLWIQREIRRRQEHSRLSGQELDLFVQNHGRRGPLWIRINHPDKKEQVLADFETQGFEVLPHPRRELTYEVRGELSLFELASRQQGLFAIQDLSSQEIGFAVDLRPGDYVWDACAGKGGKSLLLAAGLKNKGVLYATDLKEQSLHENKLRLRRAQFSNVRFAVWDGENPLPMSKELANHKGLDWVLVDAPCSASGTWRKNPEAKFRISPERLSTYPQLQKKLLAQASLAVRVGGHLVYGTCSFFVCENEEVVQWFIGTHDDFELIWAQLKGSPYEDADTSFVAVFRRIR